LHVGPGAAFVDAVYPDSPAKHAGIAAGDVILGPVDHPFTERNQVREWTMLSPVDVPARLEIVRGDARRRVTLVPKPDPVKWPELPGPPRVGSVAPAVRVTDYRGNVTGALATGKPHVLFFWATWCAPCKASLPTLLDWERTHHVPVVAITDESADQLDGF